MPSASHPWGAGRRHPRQGAGEKTDPRPSPDVFDVLELHTCELSLLQSPARTRPGHRCRTSGLFSARGQEPRKSGTGAARPAVTLSVMVNTARPTRRVRYDLGVSSTAGIVAGRRPASDILTKGNITSVERDPLGDVIVTAMNAQ